MVVAYPVIRFDLDSAEIAELRAYKVTSGFVGFELDLVANVDCLSARKANGRVFGFDNHRGGGRLEGNFFTVRLIPSHSIVIWSGPSILVNID
jgi:hypothetical protein